MDIDRNRYLTIKEAAQRSGYDYGHVHKLVRSGTVASLEITEHTRLVDYEDLQRYMAEKPQRKPHSDSKNQRTEQ